MTTFNRRKQLFHVPARGRVLVIPDILPGYRAAISVRGLSRNGQPGTAARATVKPQRK
jgi:hypothetical protein